MDVYLVSCPFNKYVKKIKSELIIIRVRIDYILYLSGKCKALPARVIQQLFRKYRVSSK